MSPIELEKLAGGFKRIILSVVTIAVFILGFKIGLLRLNQLKQNEITQRETICPSLLSISRSARDTLIVMKAEPLCNTFVLDNLK